tara:strand:- start:42 stop:263 length:222 start_codon:yes stop_codon:yes gene_type:complete
MLVVVVAVVGVVVDDEEDKGCSKNMFPVLWDTNELLLIVLLLAAVLMIESSLISFSICMSTVSVASLVIVEDR